MATKTDKDNKQGTVPALAQASASRVVDVTPVAVPATTTTTALATTAPAEPLAFGAHDDSMEGVDASDIIIPRKKIVQPTTRDPGAEPGNFRDSLTGAHKKSINIVVLRVAKSRVWWKELTDKEPSCKSNDALVPDVAGLTMRDKKPVCARCAEIRGNKMVAVCPKAQWGAERGVKPECSLTYNFLCYDLDDEVPFYWAAHGTAIKPVKRLLSAFLIRRRPPREWTVTMGLSRVTNDKGVYFVPDFTDLRMVTPGTYDPHYEAVRDVNVAAVAEEAAKADVESDEDGYNTPADDPEAFQ